MTRPEAERRVLPCPFCGSEAKIGTSLSNDAGSYEWVRCSSCGARVDAIDAWNKRALPADDGWRHKKRGTTYDIIGEATAQVSFPPPVVDGTQVIVYRCREDGSLWIRQPGEFYDGRFERVPSPPDDGGRNG